MRAERRPSRVAGFTLVEILVVVLIIGVVTAGMLLSMSFAGKDTELQTESKRLLSLMDYAREQGELQTRDYGVFFGQHGYEFVVYDVRTGAWRLASEDDALRQRTLPSSLEFKLVVDARPIVLSDDMAVPSDSGADSKSSAKAHAGQGAQKSPASASGPDSGSDSDSSDSNSPDSNSNSDSGKSFAPQVMLFSSGDLSSFSITIERANADRSITLDENRDGDIIAKPMAEGGT